ncbi:unnamed protein product [Dracunculus medinensis]|uniref:E3 ubiquitin-protein ligase n=1 Tax=Dracunculus medinensis TaxID=318479 RepID=A0A158Q5M3_DRAME|nr:unnamed protein product [Dracunculus medinensis]
MEKGMVPSDTTSDGVRLSSVLPLELGTSTVGSTEIVRNEISERFGSLPKPVNQLIESVTNFPGTSNSNYQIILENQSTQLRNMQRTHAVHTASSFLGTFVPRVQQLLGTHTHSSVRVIAIMDGLRSSNEIRQAEAAADLAEMLLLGNEESLPNLPIKEIVSVLILLLQKEHNFELMLTAARCLSNMLEALPRALPIVVDAVPYLLERLKRIECIDVAEQSLMALEVMSKRNGKNIMSAGGIAATISHLDFFSVPSQRLAFQIAANCALYVTANDFGHVRESLPELTQRLLIEDKRCLESICILFCRLVDNLRGHCDKLREIAGQNFDFLKNIQQLLHIQPCAIGPNTFQSVIRMLRYMAARCSDIAVALIDMDVQGYTVVDCARTIRFLIVGTESTDRLIEVVNRPPQHLQELVFLAGELLPPLPVDGIFSIDSVMLRSHGGTNDIASIQWLWKDDTCQWLPYNNFDSRIIEMAHSNNENELTLQINSNVYRLDLNRMLQINHVTGKERQILRRSNIQRTKTSAEQDKRQELLYKDPVKIEQVVQMLFPILSGPALRYESLRLMLRMVYPSNAELLKSLGELPLAGHVASALASPRSKDLCVVASALQLVHILVERLPALYVPLFKREGVAHEVEKLSKMKCESPPQLPPVHPPPSVITMAPARMRVGIKSKAAATVTSAEHDSIIQKQSSSRSRSSQPSNASSSSTFGISENSTRVIISPSGGRHRRKASPESPISKKDSRRKTGSAAFLQSLRLPSFRMPGTSSSSTSQEVVATNASTLSSFFPSFTSANSSIVHTSGGESLSASFTVNSGARSRLIFPYGGVASSHFSGPYNSYQSNSLSTSGQSYSLSSAASSHSSSTLNRYQKDKVRHWIRKEADYLTQKYLSTFMAGNDMDSPSNIVRMSAVARTLLGSIDVGSSPLVELKEIILENDVSPFELNHSGVLSALSKYLISATTDLQPPRKLRLKRFAAVFMSLDPDNLRPAGGSVCWLAFETLLLKLLASIAQLEQFQVKMTDMGSLFGTNSGQLRGAQAMRFFQTHQIRCNLRRHPSCRELREWRRGHGSIKVDPLTSVAAIERYLIDRGIGIVRNEDSSGDEDGSDDDEMPSDGANFSNNSPNQTRIEILINDEKIPDSITILQAIRQFSNVSNENNDQVAATANLFANTHTLYYRAAPNQMHHEADAIANMKILPPSKNRERKKIDERLWIGGEVPMSECPLDPYLSESLPVNIDDPCVPSLILLRLLYGLNRFWWSLFDDEDVPPTSHAPLLANSSFHCPKLNAKVSRQLSDFLSVATQQIPNWVSDLIKTVPFIFTFSSRRNYLYSSAFGRDRALMHLVNQVDGGQTDGESGRLTPRLERRKVSIKRDDLLRQAEQALNSLGNSKAMLEVGFEGEVGTGFGPTLEFYSTVSREIQRHSLRLWHGSASWGDTGDKDSPAVEYTVSAYGLYPAAQSIHCNKQRETRIKKFEFLGRLLAQVLIDARMLDLPLNPVFFKWLCGEEKFFGLADLEVFDKELYSSLRYLSTSEASALESLEQYFTLPSDESVELMKGGKNRLVDSSNVMQFIKLVAHWQLVEGVRREMEAVRIGFESVVNISELSIFTSEEVSMEELFCGCSEANWSKIWSENALQTAIKPDHGYTHDSDQIRWLIQMLASYNYEMQRKFLQFVTGSPKLPVGGFRSLNPPLTVVKKSGSYMSGEEELPSAMTCYNYLKIPAYSSYEVERSDSTNGWMDSITAKYGTSSPKFLQPMESTKREMLLVEKQNTTEKYRSVNKQRVHNRYNALYQESI